MGHWLTTQFVEVVLFVILTPITFTHGRHWTTETQRTSSGVSWLLNVPDIIWDRGSNMDRRLALRSAKLNYLVSAKMLITGWLAQSAKHYRAATGSVAFTRHSDQRARSGLPARRNAHYTHLFVPLPPTSWVPTARRLRCCWRSIDIAIFRITPFTAKLLHKNQIKMRWWLYRYSCDHHHHLP